MPPIVYTGVCTIEKIICKTVVYQLLCTAQQMSNVELSVMVQLRNQLTDHCKSYNDHVYCEELPLLLPVVTFVALAKLMSHWRLAMQTVA